MTTFIIKINERTKAGKAFRAMTESFFKGTKGIEIIENPTEKEKDSYNPEFVKMIKSRAATIADSNKWTTLDPNNIWESIL